MTDKDSTENNRNQFDETSIKEDRKETVALSKVEDNPGNKEEVTFVERTVSINRVAKVVKGGRRFSFSALVVVGDGKGRFGVGHGKAREVPAAVAKASQVAKSNMIQVPMIGKTIPHAVQGHDSAGTVLLRPASSGTGVIAGGPVRAIMECIGIQDILSKSLGSSNSINIVNATIDALKQLQNPHDVALRRGLPLERIAPKRLVSTLDNSSKL